MSFKKNSVSNEKYLFDSNGGTGRTGKINFSEGKKVSAAKSWMTLKS
jgi:hypothetical protein